MNRAKYQPTQAEIDELTALRLRIAALKRGERIPLQRESA
jgi:hypothetical protein